MRVLILGGDGYLGWATAGYLLSKGHVVKIVDNLARRYYDTELGTNSLVPIEGPKTRSSLIEYFVLSVHTDEGYAALLALFRSFHPDTVIHFAQQRSAPYSMIDRKHAAYTHLNNVVGNLNVLYAIHEYGADKIHLIKLGTMGEYGTPETEIPEPLPGEALVEMEYKGIKDKFLFPKRAGSWYHLTKVHDSNNIDFANRVWGLRCSDLNQGVVYGHYKVESHPTRFDYDQYFGTVINRFCCQAVIGLPLTVYGSGGQKRGFINILDTLRCIELVMLNPPSGYEVYNQITEVFSIKDLAKKISGISGADINYMDNPRVEKDDHTYHPDFYKLCMLGLKPIRMSDGALKNIFYLAQENRHRIDVSKNLPSVNWRS